MKKDKKNILVIGSAGIIGSQLVNKLSLNQDNNIYAIALNTLDFSNNVKQIVADRASDNFIDELLRLTKDVSSWDAVIDLISFDKNSSEILYDIIGKNTKQFIILSTVLVYDRTNKIEGPITEITPLAPTGRFGGYVDGKVEMEKFWQNMDHVNWTILRPYHVLGKNSLLGCVPEHNRDSRLVERIKSGECIRLVNGGNITFNFIHPEDISESIIKVIDSSSTYKQVYNLVNPEVVTAKDYYNEIGTQLNCKLNIENIPLKDIWLNKKGWEMTTLPHVYDHNKFTQDTGFTPSISYKIGIKDALQFPAKPVNDKFVIHDRMNKLPRPIKPEWLI